MNVLTKDQLRNCSRSLRIGKRSLARAAKREREANTPARVLAIRKLMVPVELVGCAKRAERFEI